MKRDDRKQVKTERDQRHSAPHDNPAADNERHISGSINIRGEIEAKRPPDLTQEHNTERNEDKTSEHKKYIMEIVTLVVVTIYAFLTLLIYCATKKAADATKISADAVVAESRPIIWLASDFGQPKYFPDPVRQIAWELRFKNYGKTPATDLLLGEIYMKVGIDGQWTPNFFNGTRPEKIPHPVAPDEEIRLDGVTPPGITQARFNELLGISSGISIKGTLSYWDASKVFHESSFCLTRLNAGGITFCNGNYIH